MIPREGEGVSGTGSVYGRAMTDSDAVVHDEEHHRYLLERDGTRIGEAVYELGDGVIRVLHTEVDESLQEHGLGSELARGMLDDIRDHSDRRLVPICPFTRAYLSKHPEYQELMSRSA
jgi:predicted GNAT family acetyltransferase